MIIERSMHPDWLSNTYLVADREGGTGVVIDAGGPSGPLLDAAERLGLDVNLLLLTHHHHDHVAEADAWRRRYGVETYAHPIEAELMEGVDRTIEPGGGSRAKPILKGIGEPDDPDPAQVSVRHPHVRGRGISHLLSGGPCTTSAPSSPYSSGWPT